MSYIDENCVEFWYARQNSNINVFEYFVGVDKLSKRANNADARINDYKLSRYACYLIAQNGNSRKKVIALAQIIHLTDS